MLGPEQIQSAWSSNWWVWQAGKAMENKEALSLTMSLHTHAARHSAQVNRCSLRTMSSIFQSTWNTMANKHPCPFVVWVWILKGRTMPREAQKGGKSGRELKGDLAPLSCTCNWPQKGHWWTLTAHQRQKEDWALGVYCEELGKFEGRAMDFPVFG